MAQLPAVSWERFYVHLAGRTNDAHKAIVANLISIGQYEVSSYADGDYILVFCPIASRVGTDIGEALGNTPGDKPIILVVMHHTFDRDHVVANSGRLVNRPNVYLTLDFLFYEGNLLKSCKCNDTAFSEVQMFFGVPTSQLSHWSSLKRWIGRHGVISLFGLLPFAGCCWVLMGYYRCTVRIPPNRMIHGIGRHPVISLFGLLPFAGCCWVLMRYYRCTVRIPPNRMIHVLWERFYVHGSSLKRWIGRHTVISLFALFAFVGCCWVLMRYY